VVHDADLLCFVSIPRMPSNYPGARADVDPVGPDFLNSLLGLAPSIDPTCPADLKADVLAALWKRRPAAPPKSDDPTVAIHYRNDYGGRPADALVFALDGVAVKLKCNVAEDAEEVVFAGPLRPGLHHLDTVYDFHAGKGGRGGRSELTFKIKPGKGQALVVILGRNDEEWPVAYLEPARPSGR
jgi:hypothetical protein